MNEEKTIVEENGSEDDVEIAGMRTILSMENPEPNNLGMVRINVSNPSASAQGFTYIYMGKDLKDATERFGESAVYSMYINAAKVNASKRIRVLMGQFMQNKISRVEFENAVKEHCAGWYPGIKYSATVVDETALEQGFMSAGNKQEYIERMMKKLSDLKKKK